jgi:DNA-binding winged helix-turn-helix (wHTH) protein/tetratricopeptide (TPR) repeat protein
MNRQPFVTHPVQINTATRTVQVNGKPIVLGARGFDVLAYLDTHKDRVVTKVELLDAVWGGMTVEEGNLTVQISALRKALGAKAIATVPGVGYKLAQGSEDLPDSPTPTEPASISALPFAASTGDRELVFLGEALTRDLTVALTRINGLRVRTTPFAEDPRPNARYLVDGAIQRAGDALRITAQLVEADTNRALWSERFSGTIGDLFALQDHVVAAISAAVERSIVLVEAERARAKTTDLEAHDLCLQATAIVFRLGSKDQVSTAKALLEQAIEQAPDYIVAKGLLCRLMAAACGARFISFQDARTCLPAAEQVLAASDADPLSMIFAANALSYLDNRQDQRKRGANVAKRAYEMSPNSSILLASAGWLHNYAGEPEAAIAFFEQALRLAPFDTYVGLTRCGLGTAYCMADDWETGIEVLEQAYTEGPDFGSTIQNLAVAHWIAGDRARAAVLRDALLARPLGVSVSAYEIDSPFRGLPMHDLLVGAMREMGLPE